MPRTVHTAPAAAYGVSNESDECNESDEWPCVSLTARFAGAEFGAGSARVRAPG